MCIIYSSIRIPMEKYIMHIIGFHNTLRGFPSQRLSASMDIGLGLCALQLGFLGFTDKQ